MPASRSKNDANNGIGQACWSNMASPAVDQNKNSRRTSTDNV